MLVDAQNLEASTRSFTAGHTDNSLWTDWPASTSPAIEFGSDADMSSTAFPSSTSLPHPTKTGVRPPHDATELIVNRLSKNVLREDFYSLLQTELPRWTREGLCSETLPTPPELSLSGKSILPPPSSYSKLERAYTAVCQLDSRMSDDLVRSRIALIQLHLEYIGIHQGQRHRPSGNSNGSTVGRGNASQVIDSILENIHKRWKALDQRRRAELRAKFHERKKYGKRWFQLASGLGPGILLICSTKLANAV